MSNINTVMNSTLTMINAYTKEVSMYQYDDRDYFDCDNTDYYGAPDPTVTSTARGYELWLRMAMDEKGGDK